MQELGPLVPIIGIALLFWLLIIRPQSKRQKAVRTMQAGLEPGSRVMLTSGIHGTLDRVEDDVVWVTVAEGVTLRVAKGAVGTVVHPDTGDDLDGPVANGPVDGESVTDADDDGDSTRPPREA